MTEVGQVERKEEKPFVERLIEALEKHHRLLVRDFKKKHKKLLSWAKTRGISIKQIQDHARATFSVGLIWAVLSTASFQPPQPHPKPLFAQEEQSPQKERQALASELKTLFENSRGNPSKENEAAIENLITESYGVSAKVELEGIKLPQVYGKIGYEQHLTRYPGDNLRSHFENQEARILYAKAGMAGGRGAFGYFANSKKELTDDLIEKEKYYLVAQTFRVKGWGKNTEFLKEWFKHRKMIVVNPKNGKAVVGVLGDAGPAAWTGRNFGGSPEVMEYIKPYDQVLILFVDDPDNQVPLGPIELPKEPELLAFKGGV